MLYRIAIFSKYRDTLIYRYVLHITIRKRIYLYLYLNKYCVKSYNTLNMILFKYILEVFVFVFKIHPQCKYLYFRVFVLVFKYFSKYLAGICKCVCVCPLIMNS